MHATIPLYVSDKYFECAQWAQKKYGRNFSRFVMELVMDQYTYEKSKEKEEMKNVNE